MEEPDLYKDFKFDVSIEELRRRANESTGRSLDEIMKDLRLIQMPQSDEELERHLRETTGRPLIDILTDLEELA